MPSLMLSQRGGDDTETMLPDFRPHAGARLECTSAFSAPKPECIAKASDLSHADKIYRYIDTHLYIYIYTYMYMHIVCEYMAVYNNWGPFLGCPCK